MEKYAGVSYAPFGSPSAVQASVLNPQPTPPPSNRTMHDSNYVPWGHVDWKAVIAKNTLYQDGIREPSIARSGRTMQGMFSSSPVRDTSPQVNMQTGQKDASKRMRIRSPTPVEDQEKDVSMSPSPEPEEKDISKDGSYMGTQQEPISISESPSPRLSPQNLQHYVDDCRLQTRTSPENLQHFVDEHRLESGTSPEMEQQLVGARISAPPPSREASPQSDSQSLEDYQSENEDASEQPISASTPSPQPLSMKQQKLIRRDSRSSWSLQPKVMPPLRYSTAIGMIPMSDDQKAIEPPRFPQSLRTENEPLSGSLPPKSSEKYNNSEALDPLVNHVNRISSKGKQSERSQPFSMTHHLANVPPPMAEQSGNTASNDAWNGPLITLGSYAVNGGSSTVMFLKSLGAVERPYASRSSLYVPGASKKRKQPDVEHSQDDAGDRKQDKKQLKNGPSRPPKKKKKKNRALSLETVGPVRRSARLKSAHKANHTPQTIEIDETDTDNELPVTTGITKFSGRSYPILNPQAAEIRRQHLEANLGRRVSDKSQPQYQATLAVDTNAGEPTTSATSLPTRGATSAGESQATVSLSQAVQNLEQTFAAIGHTPLPSASVSKTALTANANPSKRTPLPSGPVSKGTQTSIPNIKVPPFKNIVAGGLVPIIEQLGYLSFANTVYDLNGGNVTVKELENAWRAFVSTEFQKWHAGGMEHNKEWKKKKFDEAILQIEEKRDRLLKALEKKGAKKKDEPDWQIEAIEGTHQFKLVQKKVSDDMGDLHTVYQEGYPGYLARKRIGEAVPSIPKGTQLESAASWYGTPIESLEYVSTSGTMIDLGAQVKSEMAPGQTGFEGEDLYDLSGDEGARRAAPRPKLSHPSQNGVIDLTQDDDDEPIDQTMEIPDEEEEDGVDYFMNGG